MWDCRRSLCAMCLYWFKDRPKLKLSFSRSLNWFRDGIQRLSKTISSDAFCCLYVILYQFLNREIIKPFLFHIILSLSVFNGSYINLCIWMLSLLQRKQTEWSQPNSSNWIKHQPPPLYHRIESEHKIN